MSDQQSFTPSKIDTENLKKEYLSQEMGGTATTATHNPTGLASQNDVRSEIREEESKRGSRGKQSRMTGESTSKLGDGEDDDEESGSESDGAPQLR